MITGAPSMLRRAAVPCVCVMLSVFVRLPFLRWPLYVDEGSYAYVAHWWSQGLTLYSGQLWFDRPQAIFLAYRIGTFMFGESTAAIRLWGALWAAGATYGGYLVVRQLSDHRGARVAVILMALFLAAPHIEGFTANAEIFMLAPATLSAWCLLTRRWGWAGFLASAATLLKPSGLAALLLGCAWLVSVGATWRDWIKFATGAVPLPLVAVAHAAATVGIGPYLDAIVWYRLGVNLGTAYQPEGGALDGWLRPIGVWAPLVFPAFAGIATLSGQFKWFACLWLATSVVGVWMGGHWSMHYFTQLILPMAALAGLGVVRLMVGSHLGLRLVAVPVLALGLVLFVGREAAYVLLPSQVASDLLSRRPGYVIAERAAASLRSRARPGQLLYVAFYESEIYHLAGLRSVSPYLFRLDLAYIPGAFNSVVRSVAEQRPDFVLDLRQPVGRGVDTAPFYGALSTGYTPIETFDGATLYERANGR